MSQPRGIEERIKWFLNNKPSGPGMCAQHSWHALGGDNGSVPAWGCANANEVYDKVRKSGRYWTGKPKRGSLVLWRYGNNGHAAIEDDSQGLKIDTTNPDPDNSTGTATGVESIDYPEKWGASSSSRIWTDTYNGVRFPVGDEEDDVKHSFLYLSTSDKIGVIKAGSKITWDYENSDSDGLHNPDQQGFGGKWDSVGTYMVEGSGDAVLTFVKYDPNGKNLGEIGKSPPGGDLTIVQDLPKGYVLRVLVKSGTCNDARLKADIRER